MRFLKNMTRRGNAIDGGEEGGDMQPSHARSSAPTSASAHHTFNLQCVVFEHQSHTDTSAEILRRMADFLDAFCGEPMDNRWIERVQLDYSDDGYPRGVIYIGE